MSTIKSLMRRPRSWSRALTAAVLPPVCCLCGASGQALARRSPASDPCDLCDVCATLLPVLNAAGPPGSGAAVGDGTLIRTLFPFKYAYPVDHFVRALKFRGDRVFARVLGTLMARAHIATGDATPSTIVPMPLHSQRYRERGFNQAHEIAGFAASALRAAGRDIRVDSRVLKRVIATREQSGLSLEERHLNVSGAFQAIRPVPRGRIALLDDVVTTGSTAMAAALALKEAGAEGIELWAATRAESRASRTPPPQRD